MNANPPIPFPAVRPKTLDDLLDNFHRDSWKAVAEHEQRDRDLDAALIQLECDLGLRSRNEPQ